MRTFIVALAACALAACSEASDPAKTSEPSKPMKSLPTFGKVERLDPRLDGLIPADAKIEKLAEGFKWSEGPLWIRDGGYLVFSDIPNNRVNKWSEAGGLEVYLEPSGYTGKIPRGEELGCNGLILDPQKRLVLCQHGDRRMARMDAPLASPKSRFVTLAGEYGGRKLNSPNDAVYHSSGALYFTDPPYGLVGWMKSPAKELDFQGVYRLGTDGALTLLTKELTRPNGLAFSPDEKILYVANSDPDIAIWKAYDVQADGTIANGRVFFDATSFVKEGRAGLPDGLKVDTKGNLWATGPGGVLVFAPDGTHLGTINTGQKTANCAFGGDGSVLYMTAHMYLARIQTSARGDGF